MTTPAPLPLCQNIGAASCSKNAAWEISHPLIHAPFRPTHACASHLSGVLGHYLAMHQLAYANVRRLT